MTNSTGDRLQSALDRLEAVWREHDPDFAAKLVPGLTAAELDAAEARVGLTFPVELRTWFGWHNGLREQGWGLILNHRLIGIDQAFEIYDLMVDGASMFEGTGLTPEEAYWGSAWFPFLGADSPCGIDCSSDPSLAAPVYQGHSEGEPSRVSDTLAELVEWWRDLFEAGAYTRGPGGDWSLNDLRDGPESHVYQLARKYRWLAA